MCEGIVARIKKSVAGVGTCDEIFSSPAVRDLTQGHETAWQHAKPEPENERADAVLPIV